MRGFVAAGVLTLGWLLAGAAGMAHAAPGTVSLSWNGCDSPVISDVAATAGQAGGLYLVAYVEGQSDSVYSYEVQLVYGNATRTVPDAWRFDAAGCQSNARARFDHLAPASLATGCPSFEYAGYDSAAPVPLIEEINIGSGFDQLAGGLMRVAFAAAPAPRNIHPDPKVRYFVMGLAFDHSQSSVGPSPVGLSSCGGVEQPMCFNVRTAAYTTLDFVEFPFVVGASSWLTTNGFGPGCVNAQLTPAKTMTWGRLKSQYRD